ncbi:MAG: DUF3192 domain-containing protein [Desulfobacterota bacterium]|nr:DUF3192 domain-containing protein [Thermodesulfobacteriota bacterium]
MKKLGIILLSLLLVWGCSSSLEQLRTRNRENLLRLSLGMSKFDVLQIMGTETVESVNNPYRVETPKGKNGELYEVLFYHTDKKNKSDLISDSELTPIVFKDNSLIGWGWAFLSEIVPNYQYQIEVK